jgi:hypothetical protein
MLRVMRDVKEPPRSALVTRMEGRSQRLPRSGKGDAERRLRRVGPVDEKDSRPRARRRREPETFRTRLPIRQSLLDSRPYGGFVEAARNVDPRALRPEILLVEAAQIVELVAGELRITGDQAPVGWSP